MREKKISLHLNSNKPNNFYDLVESINNTISDINILEIIVHIDDGDEDMINVIKKINNKYPFLIKFIQTDLINSFSNAWKPLNHLLNQTSKSVDIIACISDDLRFFSDHWDKKLLSYDSKFKDKIYRLRCSKFKYQEYTDIWQCGYAPDSYAFYSKEWLNIVNEWCPCIGPDTYHECISYYMNKISKKMNRNIIVEDIVFSGQKVSTGINLKSRLDRTRIYYKAFFILMSYDIQKKALNMSKKLIKKMLENNKNEVNLHYNLNFFSHKWMNIKRRANFFVYRGSKNHPIQGLFLNILFIFWCYIKVFDGIIIRLIKYLYRKGIIKKLIKDKQKYIDLKEILENE